MRRLIYDMYYADEISKDIAGKLLDKLTQLALWLECSTRTIHRNMSEELKREKELLNKQL